MKIQKIDHLVLTVHDINRTCRFYSENLGMDIVTFAKGRKALMFGEQKINLHELGHEFQPKAQFPTPGSADLCLISSTPMKTIINELRQKNVPIIEGPIKKNGALDSITSVYIRDPDENLIEIANY